MPNSDLKNNLYKTKDGETQKYTALAMKETRLKQAKKHGEETGDFSEYNRLGGDVKLKELENIIHKEQNKNHNSKKIRQNAGAENQFKKEHEKDRDNANPTSVGGIPKVTKGSISDKIMSNTEVYNENIKKELNEIKYLIEYLSK